MKLLTKAQRTKLERNAKHPDEDHKPVVKLFDPCGAATWLLTEIEGNLAFGLCDLGMGMPELGYVDLDELAAYRSRFGTGIERDRWFEADRPISVYASEARGAGRIAP